ncbi:hypothetical protein PSTT_12060 [Puccinia striiformis]|uniref:Uncharacterized protein n=1 Tax=Puccinia striiformis TaxID=27350 RepID=A0A2S4UXS6_9BASI|nr:hypothetical protein PSTT_12060 [Puccinia striiformis]
MSAKKDEDIPESEKWITEQHRHQGDLIVTGFTSLKEKCKTARILTPPGESAPLDRLDFKRGLVAQLKSSLLPELRQHTDTLADLLKPDTSLKGPTPKLDLLLEIQAGLDQTLEKIYAAVGDLCPGGDTAYITGNNDQDEHLNELKSYRLHGLYTERTHSPTQAFTGTGTHEADVPSARECIVADVSDCHEVIDLVTNWIEGSEFDIVQAPWVHDKYRIGEMLEIFMLLINRSPELRYLRAPLRPLREPVIELARKFVPIIKLLRLIFEKLSERGMNKKRLPTYTTMNSEQLDSIGKLVEQVVDVLETIKSTSYSSSLQSDDDTAGTLIYEVGSFEYRFENLFRLISLHFLPILPDTEGSPTQNYYQAWLDSWNDLFTIATNNFEDAVNDFLNNH